MSLVIEDKASGFLRQLGIVAPGYINEALSKGAFLVYENIQYQASRYKDDFSQYHTKGKRGITAIGVWSRTNQRNKVLTNFGKAYDRYDRSTPNQRADGAKSMAELTRWKLYDYKMKAVVGWMNTKSYSPTNYKNGKAVGTMPRVKGVRLYDPKDKARRHNIGEMMEYGGKETLSEAQKRLFAASGMGKVARRGYVMRKARPIVIPAFNATKGQAEQRMIDVVSKIVDYKEANREKRGVA